MYVKGDRIKCIQKPKPYFTVGKAYEIYKVKDDQCWVKCDDGEYRSFSMKNKELFAKYFKDIIDFHVGDIITCYKTLSSSFGGGIEEGKEYKVVATSDKHVRVTYGGIWLDKGRFRNLRIERKLKLKKLYRDNGL